MLPQCVYTIAAAMVIGCGTERDGANTLAGELAHSSSSNTSRFEDAFQLIDSITLDEPPGVINVYPNVTTDPLGGFFVADPQEGQFRRYAAHGDLLLRFGVKDTVAAISRHLGFDEGTAFETPMAAVRMTSGSILGLDAANKMAVFDSAQGNWLRSTFTGLRRVNFARLFEDSLLLIGGKFGDLPDEEHLHVWSLSGDSLLTSFFTPVAGTPHVELAAMAGFVSGALRGDTIAATYSLSDTVYLYTTNGTYLHQVPVPSALFRRPIPPPQDVSDDFEARREWLASFDVMNGIFWTKAGDLVIQYQTIVKGARRWSLLGVTTSGEQIFEARDTPRLLAVDEYGTRFVFITPGARESNKWSFATLR